MKCTSVVLIIATLCVNEYLTADTDNPCPSLENCSACTQNPQCAWCSQSDFHGQDKKPLSRCNSIEAHEQLGPFKCAKNHLFKHSNEMVVSRNESLSNGERGRKVRPIRPQELSLKLRVKDPVEFDIHYQALADYPLDLYYLMDGTLTMNDDKEVLEGLGDSIGQRLRSLTSQFRQGFGTFVDKVTMPYVSSAPINFEYPCFPREDYCIPPYGFKNRMQLSNDTEKFSENVKSTVLSASSDGPEGGFDALMQVMVCNKNIGWSEQARRLIIFATDAPFHFAGDGRLGGMILPNDGECHMDANGEYYTHSLVSDYPSMAQLNAKAREHSINIIFAVTSREIGDYKRLESIIEGSKSTELASNSSNIVDLVEEEYKKIKARVEIKDSFPSEFFQVRYYSKCQDDTEEVEQRICEGLQAGSVVQFRVEIELMKCPTDPKQWKQQYKIYAVGVPASIEIDVETLCDCPCEKNRIPNSPLCGRVGSEICGLCECNANYWGKHCECSAGGSGDKRRAENMACKNDNSTELCSGKGNCHCGECICLDTRYTGQYCECDNKNCPLKNELLCAGHGSCDCGKCLCDSGWQGEGCDCSTDKLSCVEPGSVEECSGKGNCICGKCKCLGRNSGKYCENCLHPDCPNRCDELKHCVQCKVHGTGIFNPSDCELNCFRHTIIPVDIITTTGVTTNEFMCKAEDPSDECVFIFSYTTNRDKTVIITAQTEKECPTQAPIFWIVVAVSSIVVVAGLILLCVYQAYTKIQVKREFAAYEKERTNVTWGQQTNPIYNNPVGVFKNPTYAGND